MSKSLSPDDAKRDEVLKKMLQTKPQPRKPKPAKKVAKSTRDS